MPHYIIAYINVHSSTTNTTTTIITAITMNI